MTNAPATRETADHAELARLRQHIANLKLRPGHHVQFGTPSVVQVPNYWNRDLAADLEALLSEIAALRGERDGLKNRVSCLERLGGEQSTRVMEQATRAKDAERQRDELRKALDRQCDNMSFVLNRVELHAWAEKFSREAAEDRALLANQGADQ